MSKIIEGKYTSAKVYRDDIEEYAEAQIKMLCDMEIHKDAKIQIMPDVHPGKVAPIGFTMIMNKENAKIMPALVGNDIGCGVSIFSLQLLKRERKNIDFNKLDKTIKYILSNNKIYNDIEDLSIIIDGIRSIKIPDNKIKESFGTIGEGNHFIEIDKDDEDNLYLVIHSGSRNIGNMIYEYYMKIAHDQTPDIPYELSYLSSKNTIDNYFIDTTYASKYGYLNRSYIAKRICKAMRWNNPISIVSNIHNQILLYEDKYIITKGANCIINTNLNGILNPKPINSTCIPINSIDGTILAIVKNDSKIVFTPHGAGRIMKRTEVANTYTVSDYKKLMKSHNVYFSNCKNTLDEAPIAYRNIDQIITELDFCIDKNTLEILTPIYNYKNGGNN